MGLQYFFFAVAGLFLVLFLAGPAAAADAQAPLPRVHILATGGTIAGTAQNATDMLHYQPGTIGIDTLIASVPELTGAAQVTGEQVCNLNSDDITPVIWLNLSHRVNQLLQSPETDGIVITHGTDTLEETAYFLDLVTKSDKPVVITGAMRPATALSADGPLNLLEAVQLAGSREAAGKGVLVLLNGEINAARDTTKTNTQSTGTFRSPDFGPLGYMEDGKPQIFRLPARNHTTGSEFDVSGLSMLPRVDIIATYPGMDTTAIDAFVQAGTEGLVVTGMGNGEYPSTIGPALQAAAGRGIPVVVASRTGSGIATAHDPHFLSAGTLNPQKARILLMLALTKTNDRDRIAEMFAQY
ncbi:asparaginase [Methanoregula sp.]|uniref:asparaginase n=1 Tax=Methanoregula sp. TaxID=2052170 RepID=UPI002B970BE1|nr:asparaginase [Methanoregula sp.]HVP97604.1 asparaginase [Methanoregula sp.]